MTNGASIAELIRQRFPDAGTATGEFREQHWVELTLDRLLDVCSWLRDDEQAAFDFLVDVTAVHKPHDPEPFELVYHLFSYVRNDRLRLKARTTADRAVPSLSGIWKAAEWNERETFDMFGIRFEGHPDLRRILMPDDYTDFPLLKEFPLYRG